MRKLLFLKLDGDLEQGVRVTLTIEQEDNRPGTEVTGKLPPNPNLATSIEQWRCDYRSLGEPTRIQKLKVSIDVPIIPIEKRRENCQKSANDLRCHLNQWLLAESFRPIRDTFREFIVSNEVRVLIRTSSQSLLKLPWHLWDLVENYRHVEVALCPPDSHPKTSTKRPTLRGKVKILAILGNSDWINVQKDGQVLENLPDAVTTFPPQPERREINDSLWSQPWYILFFAGHSETQGE